MNIQCIYKINVFNGKEKDNFGNIHMFSWFLFGNILCRGEAFNYPLSLVYRVYIIRPLISLYLLIFIGYLSLSTFLAGRKRISDQRKKIIYLIKMGHPILFKLCNSQYLYHCKSGSLSFNFEHPNISTKTRSSVKIRYSGQSGETDYMIPSHTSRKK